MIAKAIDLLMNAVPVVVVLLLMVVIVGAVIGLCKNGIYTDDDRKPL